MVEVLTEMAQSYSKDEPWTFTVESILLITLLEDGILDVQEEDGHSWFSLGTGDDSVLK
jgi:hypothetical protein